MPSEQPFSRIVEIFGAEELIDLAFRRASKVKVSFPRKATTLDKAKVRERARATMVYQVVSSKLYQLLRSFPRLESLHPFYKELLELVSGISNVRNALKGIARTRRLVKEIYNQTLREIKSAKTPSDCTKLRKSFYGRAASLLRDADTYFRLIETIRRELKDIPAINFDEVKVVIAGYPGVGKSTLVSLISSAKPLIGKYPFTTKDVIVGHIRLNDEKIQVIDTPGLLEKPIKKMKKEELKALSALKLLADVVIFIVDVAETSGFTIEQQWALLDSLMKYIEKRDRIVVLNKIDLAREEQVARAKSIFGEKCLQTSLTKGWGINELVDRLFSLCKSYTSYRNR